MVKRFCQACALMALFMLVPVTGLAQFVRTSYFMDGAQYRLQLNPALAPERGYVNLPGIGQVNASYYSNTLGLDDAIDVIKNAEDADYFTSNKFYDKLKDMNRMTLNAGTDLIGVGFWHGKEFMSVNVSVKADGNLRAPLEMFTFMRDMKGVNANDYSNYNRSIKDGELSLNTYAEVGFSYTRIINEHVTLGGRVKGLLGLGNMNLKLHQVDVQTNLVGLDPHLDWTTADPLTLARAEGTASVDVVAELESSMHGLNYIVNNKGYIDDIEFKAGKMGVSGFGAGLDFGIEYNVTKDISLSAAINDLGFIKWSKGNTIIAHAKTDDLDYDSDNPGDMERFADVIATGKLLNWDMLRLNIDQQGAKARTTNLTSTLALGAEYRLVNDKLHLGMLYTNRFVKSNNQSELTLAVNYSPRSLLDFAVSYSPIMCGGQSFGLAMKLGPLFVGTDYMYLSNGTKCCNALVGISVPLGSRSAE